MVVTYYKQMVQQLVVTFSMVVTYYKQMVQQLVVTFSMVVTYYKQITATGSNLFNGSNLLQTNGNW